VADPPRDDEGREAMQLHRIVGRLRRRAGKWTDRGMSTVEYALGTLAAAAFALGLMRILTSQRVGALLSGVIERALTKPF
jgi:hypothetical protein